MRASSAPEILGKREGIRFGLKIVLKRATLFAPIA